MHIAIAGCGQLSRMMALAGIPLGFRFSFIADPDEDARCVEGLGEIQRWQPGQAADQLYQDLGEPDALTVEKEQVNLELLSGLGEHCPLRPGLAAIKVCQNRLLEKQLLDSLGIACSPYTYGVSAQDSALTLSLPAVVKSCREGYDGKNQWVLKTREDAVAFDAEIGGGDHIIESWIPFDKEVSQISLRSVSGEISHYPLTENLHDKGILRQSIAPATGIPATTAARARRMMTEIMQAVDYVGVMAMECFLVGDQLLVNELAPRVHNSGHWTQSGSNTCQFENHLRAIAGLPLGNTAERGVAGMINLIGTQGPPLASLSEHSKLHWYNKSVRPGRKLGHVNFTSASYEALSHQMNQFQETSLISAKSA